MLITKRLRGSGLEGGATPGAGDPAPAEKTIPAITDRRLPARGRGLGLRKMNFRRAIGVNDQTRRRAGMGGTQANGNVVRAAAHQAGIEK